ncbi:MAG: UDP-galactopyranose mutase, partial [Clostridia bacterium]|nr:UDP-galactopyranose mutase [Clostridia bacterium]
MGYDYLIVGAGLFGATCANLLHKNGKRVLLIEKRPVIAGNVYTGNIEGINVHMHGAHIFHTDFRDVWDYVNSFSEFNRFTNSPVARIGNEIYNLPFNMNTFSRIWSDVFTPEDARRHIDEERREITGEPQNLEEQAISLVGRTVYEKLIKGYTEKQWNRSCKELPAFIIKRLPLRFVYDNNYFNDKYQGIPVGGYTAMVERMLEGIDVRLGCDFFEHPELRQTAEKIIYTGPLDEFYGFRLGRLEYRSLKFDTKVLDCENFQGNAVVNYTGSETAYTRVIEHKHFEPSAGNPKTVVTYEYPSDYEEGMEKY